MTNLPTSQIVDLAARCGIKASEAALVEFASLVREAEPLAPEAIRPTPIMKASPQMNHMTPLQQLARLRDIESLLHHSPCTRDEQISNMNLLEERKAILSDVGRPPATLIGVHSAADWAAAFAAAHPVDQVTAYEWFAKFHNQVSQYMYPVGHADGKRDGVKDIGRLVDLNKTLLSLFDRRVLRDIPLRDDTSPDGPPIKASEHIRKMLEGMGVDL